MQATRLLTRSIGTRSVKNVRPFSTIRNVNNFRSYNPSKTLHQQHIIQPQILSRTLFGKSKEEPAHQEKEFAKDIPGGVRVGVRSKDKDNVEVFLKLGQTVGHEVHEAVSHMLTNSKETIINKLVPSDSVSSKVLGAVGSVVNKVVGTSDDQSGKESKAHSRSLWIPLFGTVHTHTDAAGDSEVAFEFNKRNTKGAEQLFNPAKSEAERLGLAVKIVIDSFTKIPFASKIAEKLTKTVLHKII